MKRSSVYIIVTLIIFSSLGIFIPYTDPAYGSVLNVGSDQTYTSIQSAINDASDGDIIKVHTGTYEEDIRINKKITLVGNGSSETQIIGKTESHSVQLRSENITISDLSIRTKAGSLNFGMLILKDSHNSQLVNLTISDSYRGLEVYGINGQENRNLVMKNCTFSNILKEGTRIYAIENSSFLNNTFMNCEKGLNIIGEGGNLKESVTSTTISGNEVQDCGDGIVLKIAYGCIIKNNHVVDCDRGISVEKADSTIVGGNWVENSIANIRLYQDLGVKVENNTIYNPSEKRSKGDTGYGIYMDQSRNMIIKNNTFKETGLLIAPTSTAETRWYTTHTISGNEVNGKDLLYYHNRTSFTTASNAGQIIMAYCDDVDIKDQKIEKTTMGILALECSSLNISDVVIDHSYYGIYTYNEQRDLSIYDRTVVTENNSTIVTDNSTFTNITGSSFSDNYLIAIRISGDMRLHNVNVRNSTFNGSQNGVYSYRDYRATKDAKKWTIENNTISNMSGSGLYLYMLRFSLIKNNTITNSTNGIRVLGSNKGGTRWNADGHEIMDNSISVGVKGIHTFVSDDTIIRNNHIEEMEDYGIYLESCDDALARENTIKECDKSGIYLYGWNPHVLNNMISGPGMYGIRAYVNNGMKAWYNQIDNISKYGFFMDNSIHSSVKHNSLKKCGFFIWGVDIEDWTTNSYFNNTVNGRKMYYSRGGRGNTVPTGVGQVILHNCNDYKIENLNLSHASVGVQIIYGDDNKIMNCTMDYNYYGLYTDQVNIYSNAYCLRNTIKNCSITNARHTAVRFDHAGSSQLIDCNLSGSQKFGIWAYESDKLKVWNNKIIDVGFPSYSDGSYGFHVEDCASCNIFGNEFRKCGLYLYETDSINDLKSHTINNNTVNGRDLVYISQQNPSNYSKVPGGAGQIFIVQSSKMIIEDQNLSFCGLGLYAFCSYDLIIRNCSFNWNIHGFGIHSFYPKTENCVIENNTFLHDKSIGLKFHSYYSNWPSHNVIQNNKAMFCGSDGISLKTIATNNTVFQNHAEENGGWGIYIWTGMDGSRKNYVMNNTIINNEKGGLYDTYGDGGEISGNVICDNSGDGIFTTETWRREIKNNLIQRNKGYGINLQFGNYMEVYGNLITDSIKNGLTISNSWYLNKFYNNTFVYNGGTSSQGLDDAPYVQWDDGMYGNWWSNWTGPDADKDGIIDAPYNIDGDENRQDRYPRVWINNAPEIKTENVLLAVEDIHYRVEYKAFDPDPLRDVLSWSIHTNSNFLNLDKDTGELTGTPDDSDIGTYWVNISVSDGKGGKDWTNFTLTVQNVNDDPIIITRDRIGALVDDHYNNYYKATDDDPGGDTLSWSVSTNASFLSMASATGRLHGTPSPSDVGSYWINVSVSDGMGGADWTVFTLTVFSSNILPIITTSDDTSAVEDEHYYRDYDHSDPEGLPPFWKVSTNASFLSIDSLTGILQGNPENDDVGSYWVNVSVEDSLGGVDWSNYTLTIKNVNDDPVITTTDQLTVMEDVEYRVDYSAIDVDPTNDILFWSLTTSCDFLSITSGSGLVNGTPENEDVGTYWVNISVSDQKGGSDFTNFTLKVANTNDNPVITNPDIADAVEDEEYSVQYFATDDDPTGDKMAWSLSTNASFLQMGSNSGKLNGTPENADVGSFWINVTVGDGNGGYDHSNFTLTVQNVNDDPVINTPNLRSAIEDVEYISDYNAIDIDPTQDTLIWSMSTNGDFLVMDSSSGILNGTPDNGDVGDYWVNVSVIDGRGGNDWRNFSLEVVNINDRPVITNSPFTNATEDTKYHFQMNSVDVDPTLDTMKWSMETNSSFLSINKYTGVIKGTPRNDDVGLWWINISVTDGRGGSDHHYFEMSVINTNDDPVIQTEPGLVILEDDYYLMQMTATDEDPTNDVLTWSVSSNAGFLSIDPETGELQGTPQNDDVGEWEVNLTVIDGNGGSDHLIFHLMVKNTNDAPDIITDNINEAVEDEQYQMKYEAIDVDPTNDRITWSLDTNASFLSLGRISGNLMGDPGNDDVGTYWVNITVTDEHGASTWTNFKLEVVNVNDNPEIKTSPISEIDEDSLYEVVFTGGDIDPTSDVMTWTLVTEADFLSMDSLTGRLHGIPENDNVGDWEVNVSVQDGNGGSDFILFHLTVKNTNDAPEILTTEIPVAVEDEDYMIILDGIDVDPTADIIIWRIDTNASFLDIEKETGTLTGNPENDDVGTYWINISLSDRRGGETFRIYQLNVLNVNDPPEVITGITFIDLDEEELYELDLDSMFRDIDGPKEYYDFLTYDIAVVMEEGKYFIAPGLNYSGVSTIVIIRNDSHSEVTHEITVRVFDVNDPPVIRSVIPSETYVEGEPIIVPVDVVDSDDENLTFEWSIDKIGMIGTGKELDLDLSPGTYIITLEVSDSDNSKDEITFELVVEAKEDRSGTFGILLIVILVIVILASIAVIGWFFLYKKRKEDNADNEMELDEIADNNELTSTEGT